MTTFGGRILLTASLLGVGLNSPRAQNYSIDWFTIDGGGGTSTGGGYSMSSSIAQADVGTLSGGGYTLEGGFWSIVAAATPRAIAFDANLILNPGAEAGAGSVSGNDFVSVPNWTTASNFTVLVYDASLPSPGPAFGTNVFAGGPDTPLSTATQTIDVSAIAAEIDSATVTAELSGYFGGFLDQNDRASLTATYLSASSNTLQSFSVGNVLAADRTNRSVLLYRATSNAVPAGTRNIQLILRMTRDAGNYNDGYADNLSLVLRASELRITAAERIGNDLHLNFTSVAGRNYCVQSRADLSSGAWTNLPGAPISGTGGTLQVSLPNALGQPQQFFRVQVVP